MYNYQICHDWQVPGSEFICQALSTFVIFTGGEHICLDWHLSNTGHLYKVEVEV